jgi:hypothetical protein
MKVNDRNKKKNIEAAKERVLQLPGVKSVDVHVSEDLFDRFAGGMR